MQENQRHRITLSPLDSKRSIFLVSFLCVLVVLNPLEFYPSEHPLSGLFVWSQKNYLDGDYRGAIENISFILSLLQDIPADRLLRAKCLLLMGAAHEKRGDSELARNYYLAAQQLDAGSRLSGVETSSLIGYQHVILGNKDPVQPRVVEKIGRRQKRKTIFFAVIGITLLAAFAATYYFINRHAAKRKTPPADDITFPDLEWIKIPAGPFKMGDNFNEGRSDERPVHEVYLDEFHISQHEITCHQFGFFVLETGHPDFNGNYLVRQGSYPMYNVSWHDARLFCAWFSQRSKKNIKLPTEAQWEKAARGTDQRRYPWGNFPPDCEKANYCCQNHVFTIQVGTKIEGVSPYGVFDMAGNISEWCRDYYSASYYQESPHRNPTGPPQRQQDERAVVRGGSYLCGDNPGVRSAQRSHSDVNYYTSYIGFRVVWEYVP